MTMNRTTNPAVDYRVMPPSPVHGRDSVAISMLDRFAASQDKHVHWTIRFNDYRTLPEHYFVEICIDRVQYFTGVDKSLAKAVGTCLSIAMANMEERHELPRVRRHG